MTQKNEAMKLTDKVEWEVIPSYGRLLVKLFERDSRTAAGLYLPDTAAKDRATTGTVVAIPERMAEEAEELEKEGRDVEPYFKVGDVLIFGRYTGTEIKVGDDSYIILGESNVLAKLQVKGGGPVPLENVLGEVGPAKIIDRD